MADLMDHRTNPAGNGFDRVLPHNLEAEQAVLGSMFLSSEAVEGALSML
jgi:hypothetical protein